MLVSLLVIYQTVGSLNYEAILAYNFDSKTEKLL
jgi:hypothetical protein